MNLLGVSLKLTDKELQIKVARVEVTKETGKMYKVKGNMELIFNCLENIPKDKIGIVQHGSFGDFVNGFERKLWDIDDSTSNEQKMIEHLKMVAGHEMERRKFIYDNMLSKLN